MRAEQNTLAKIYIFCKFIENIRQVKFSFCIWFAYDLHVMFCIFIIHMIFSTFLPVVLGIHWFFRLFFRAREQCAVLMIAIVFYESVACYTGKAIFFFKSNRTCILKQNIYYLLHNNMTYSYYHKCVRLKYAQIPSAI